MMPTIFSLLLFIFFMSDGLLTLGLKEEANMSLCIEKERQALLDVKANLNDVYGLLDDWGSQEELDCCKWTGVSCNSHTGHVIEIDLDFVADDRSLLSTNFDNSFRGKISPSLQVLNQLQHLYLNYVDFQYNPLPGFLASMSTLQSLQLSSANLSGPIPHKLANLSNLLHLDLSSNSLTGSIPFFFGDFTSLTYLDLSQNQLGGVIPNFFGNVSSLAQLNLSQNLLNGSLPTFSRCSSLIYLSLSHNSLNGSMPDFTRCTSLQTLDISNNLLSGNIPDSVGQVSNLVHVDFSSNSLEGVISDVHFSNLTYLDYLDMSSNFLALNLSFHRRIPSQLSTIKLQSCKLGPSFPMWIEAQKSLKHLDISSARISGGIPKWFWDLSRRLEFMNLSSNDLEGILPDIDYFIPSYDMFGSYAAMDLSNNRFEGRVPSLPPLTALNLSGNRFSETLSFVCKFNSYLSFLDLSNNSFSGSLPDCWLMFQENLVVLNLSNNNLSGEIPSSLGFLSELESLYLRTNSFVGEVPLSLSNCTRLRFLDLGENKLSGVIPEWIGEKLSELYILVLGSNRLKGSLPSQICWLYNLHVLDVSNNGLSGKVPRCFSNFTAMARRSIEDDMTSHSYYSFIPSGLSRRGVPYQIPWKGNGHSKIINPYEYPNAIQMAYYLDNALVTWKGKERSFERRGLQLLKSIDLSRNKLSGKVPYEITSLYDLASLNLSINSLHGEVPKDMGWLKYLESLDLSRNEFSGHIPWSLAQLNFLSYLDLSFNNLSGRIPTGTQLQGFNYTSYRGNPQLCGPPLTPRCVVPLVVEKEDAEEDEDNFWKSYYIGMGAGFAFGFLGVCGTLVLNRRCRYFFFASLSHMKDWIYVTVVVFFGKIGRKFRR